MKKKNKNVIARAWRAVRDWIETLKAMGNWNHNAWM